MSDREYAKQKKRVQKYIDKWYKTLGLGWHQIDIEWEREGFKDHPEAAGETQCMWQYMSGWVAFNLPVIRTMNDDQVENMVVHEFVHVLTWPMWLNAGAGDKAENEYATEAVARALIWTRDSAIKSQENVV